MSSLNPPLLATAVLGFALGWCLKTFFETNKPKKFTPPQITSSDSDLGKFEQKGKNSVNRLKKRATYDKQTVFKILDEAVVCQVGFIRGDEEESRHPAILPMIYGREEETIYLHGHASNKMLKRLSEGVEVCISIMLLDGLVYARSTFNSSMNYRSVTLFGRATLITDEVEKNRALHIITDHTMPERWRDARPPNATELKSTSVLKFEIETAGCKVRTGPPGDDKEDIDTMTIWSGVLPVYQTLGIPQNDPTLKTKVEAPSYIANHTKFYR